MEKICEYIVKKFINLSDLHTDDETLEVYVYGLSCYFYTIIPSFILMAFSFVFRRPIEMVFWILIFLTLRKFAGGIHAKTAINCLFSSVLLGLSALIICSKVTIDSTILYFILVICNMIPLFILAPATNKIFSDKQKLLCKFRLAITTLFLTIILYFFPFLQTYYLHALFSTTFLCIAKTFKK